MIQHVALGKILFMNMGVHAIHYHLPQNHYSFDALQAYCFGINLKL